QRPGLIFISIIDAAFLPHRPRMCFDKKDITFLIKMFNYIRTSQTNIKIIPEYLELFQVEIDIPGKVDIKFRFECFINIIKAVYIVATKVDGVERIIFHGVSPIG